MRSVEKKVEDVLTRGVSQILPSKDGLKKLMLSRKITLYQGFDPSMPSLHLGNVAGLMKLRQFQKLGHKVIFLIGGFSGMIGDPTDKVSVRRKLSREEVENNFSNWKYCVEEFLDLEGNNKAEIKNNFDWLNQLSPSEFLDICSNVSYQQLIERDMFQKRIKENKPIYIHELLYPILTGYDSIFMDVDLEIGGNDQTFNMLMGRTLIKSIKNKEKYVLTTKLLVDKEGNKVGKTTGNALFLDSKPEDFYGGIMSFPDDVIYLSYELLTDVELEGLREKIDKDPMQYKKKLAYEITKLIYDEAKAEKAKLYFENTFQKGEIPQNLRELVIGKEGLNLADAVTYITKSKSQAKRLLLDKAVDVNGDTTTDPKLKLSANDTIKVGKKDFLKIIGKGN